VEGGERTLRVAGAPCLAVCNPCPALLGCSARAARMSRRGESDADSARFRSAEENARGAPPLDARTAPASELMGAVWTGSPATGEVSDMLWP